MPNGRPSPTRPATFREVFAQREYRFVLTAGVLSWVGDYLAKAAVALLVYRETESVALSAAAFAISYLPWLVGGPLLAAVAERHPHRTVMVTCDLIRMVLLLVIAVPGMPTPLVLALLFTATLANPPSQAARSALLPRILAGDRLVVGVSINASVGQAAQVVGYLAGAAIAATSPTLALLITSATYAVSATLIRRGVVARPTEMQAAHRSNLLRETGEGFRIVFGQPVLRAIAILVFSAMLFSIVPEGLAAAWAGQHADDMDKGLAQAIIMAAVPAGYILGGLVIGRLVAPARRIALMRPLAVLAPLLLVPTLLDPSPLVVALLAAGCGFAVAGLLPTANGLFVQALPDGYRARAFGVMASGTQVIQGLAVLVTGLLAERFSIPLVVGLWSSAGVLLMTVAALSWPSQARVDAAVEAASGAAVPDPAPAPPAPRAGSSAVDRPGDQLVDSPGEGQQDAQERHRNTVSAPGRRQAGT